MARLESIPWLLSSLVIACQSSPTLVPSFELDTARVILALPLADDEFDLTRARLFLPGDAVESSGQIVLDEEESLILVAIDEPALARGLSAVPVLDPARMSLHASSGLDCGSKGRELRANPDGTTQVRQALHRFQAPTYALNAGSKGFEAPEPSVDALLSSVELELPANAEPCGEWIRIEIEPFGVDQIFGQGVNVDGVAVPRSALTKFIGVHPATDDRIFLLTRVALFAVRRGQLFDQTVDSVLRIEDVGLPTRLEETWSFDGSRIETLGAPGAFRVVGHAARVDLERERNGGAVFDIDFDGVSFSTPRIRHLSEEIGVDHFSSSASEGSLVAGTGGRWTLIPPDDGPIDTGTLGRGDIEVTAMSGRSDAPHLLGIRGGFIGLGDLRDMTRFAIQQVRAESGAHHLRVAMHGAEAWLYSGWKDGRVLRQPLVSSDQSETVEIELPRRLVTCGTVETDTCGRGHPTKRVYGLEVPNTPAPSDLVLLTYEGCSTLLVHHVGSGCTTGLDLPLPETVVGTPVWLQRNEEGLWATTESSWPEIYRVHIRPAE